MAQQNSFDIVSQVDTAEVANAINQTVKSAPAIRFQGQLGNVVLKRQNVLTRRMRLSCRNIERYPPAKLVRRAVPLKALSLW